MKKILFSDIDGTILENFNPISKRDQEAISRLRKEGHYFAFCTGRNYQETKVISHFFEYDYMVLNNGAMIVDKDDQILLRKQVKNEVAKKILRHCLKKYPYLNYSFYDGNHTYMYFGKDHTCLLTEHGFEKIDEDFVDLFENMKDDFDIFCVDHPEGKLDEVLEIQKYIDENYKGVHGTLNTKFLDITVDHCSKGTGLLELTSLVDEKAETYCIGDSYNDISMFQTAMHSYTFHRVEDELKKYTEKQVDYVYELIEDMLEG